MPVWPGDAPCRCGWTSRLAADGANVAELAMSAHTGTHADGPYHVLDDGDRIGDVPLEAFIGPAHVIDVSKMREIGRDWIDANVPAGCHRLLMRTRAWANPHVFPVDWPALTPDAAQAIVGRGIVLLGTDAPSPEPADAADLPVHRILLGAGIPIIENLLLDGVADGAYELIALPLRLAEADASPVRAVLVAR